MNPDGGFWAIDEHHGGVHQTRGKRVGRIRFKREKGFGKFERKIKSKELIYFGLNDVVRRLK